MAGPAGVRDCVADGPFRYTYPRPALTVDCAVFSVVNGSLRVLLIRRASDPFAGRWALPGGFVDPEEPLEKAALRELVEETGVAEIPLWPAGGYGDPGRDPRGWTVSVVYYAVLPPHHAQAKAGDDAVDARFHAIRRLPPLAFDHRQIVSDTLARLRREIYSLPVVRPLVSSDPFPAAALHELYRQLDGEAPAPIALMRKLSDAGLVARAGTGYRFVD